MSRGARSVVVIAAAVVLGAIVAPSASPQWMPNFTCETKNFGAQHRIRDGGNHYAAGTHEWITQNCEAHPPEET